MLQMEAARKTPSMNSLRSGINCRLSPANTYLDQTPPCHWTRLIKLSKSHIGEEDPDAMESGKGTNGSAR